MKQKKLMWGGNVYESKVDGQEPDKKRVRDMNQRLHLIAKKADLREPCVILFQSVSLNSYNCSIVDMCRVTIMTVKAV
jgi:hypothetical protein